MTEQEPTTIDVPYGDLLDLLDKLEAEGKLVASITVLKKDGAYRLGVRNLPHPPPPSGNQPDPSAWIELNEANPPPENVRLWCLTKAHGEMHGERRGNVIHIGKPDSWKTVVTHWRFPKKEAE